MTSRGSAIRNLRKAEASQEDPHSSIREDANHDLTTKTSLVGFTPNTVEASDRIQVATPFHRWLGDPCSWPHRCCVWFRSEFLNTHYEQFWFVNIDILSQVLIINSFADRIQGLPSKERRNTPGR